MIDMPKLPPREGFVEVENDDGERVYEKVVGQLAKEQQQAQTAELIIENAELKSKVATQENTLATLMEEILPILFM